MARRPNAEPIPRGAREELQEKGFEVERVEPMFPIVGLGCTHEPRDLRVVAKGKTSMVMLRCMKCGRSGPFMPLPERNLSSAETDLMVALAREAAWWKGRAD